MTAPGEKSLNVDCGSALKGSCGVTKYLLAMIAVKRGEIRERGIREIQ